MPLPTILFGVILSTFYGALFHLCRGGSLRRLLLYLTLAWVGYWLGDTLGWILGWSVGAIGLMNAGMGTIGAVLLLFLGDFISRIEFSAK